MRTRLAAATRHLGITLLVLAGISATAVLVWYPAPYFQVMDAQKYLLLMIGLTIGLGPLLTLVVYKPGKKGLGFDLLVIALVQISVLAYTGWSLWDKRPYFMVFAVDRFNVLTAADIDFDEVGDARLLDKPLIGPILLVAKLPSDQKEREQLMMETLFEGKPDVERRPQYWSLYAEDFPPVINYARPLEKLIAARPNEAAALRAAAARSGLGIDQLVFWPVEGRAADFAVLLSREDGSIQGAVQVNPWM